MAVHIDGLLEKSLNDKIKECNILVVGAGGVGCELLKDLVLTGFERITVVDLDTIELSNLNRQFLFHKQHIGRPKAIVARESVLKFNPKANIIAHHDSINNSKYDHAFYKEFSLVANALDNVAARSHVNRMCMKAEVPLIESGSAGYLGQITVYKKSLTECYECVTHLGQKVYPSCTIRNTPSEPVHCIVWAKHLFSQLFGEVDADNEVSPDMADPELGNVANPAGNVKRISTKEWAKAADYDPAIIFSKLFREDIAYLNTMNDLWEKRCRPVSLDWDSLQDEEPGSSNEKESQMADHVVWSLKQCRDEFARSLAALKKRSNESGSNSILTLDKDDDIAMDFVAACSNLRSHCFHIERKTRFDIKAIAGNIVPAIASTNAVIAGLIVLQTMKVLKGDFSKCKNAFLNEQPNGGKMISNQKLEKPNDKCFVCSDKTPEIYVNMNLKTLTIRSLGDKILKEKLHMVQPEVTVQNSARIIISADPEEMDVGLCDKTFADMEIGNFALHCEDDLQQYHVILWLKDSPEMRDQEFIFEGEVPVAPPVAPPTAVNEETRKAKAESGIIEMDIEDGYIEEVPVVREPTKEDIPEVGKPTKMDVISKNKIIDDENGVLPPAKRAKTAAE